MLLKIKQNLCANVLKGGSQRSVDKEQFKIKRFQTIYKVKINSTQKQIPRQKEKVSLISAIIFLYSMCKI